MDISFIKAELKDAEIIYGLEYKSIRQKEKKEWNVR